MTPAATTRGEIVVAERFRGPPASGNGGYVAGRLAAWVDAPVVEVRLAAPPPLAHPLAVVPTGDGIVELRDGEDLVALARAGELELEVPRPVPVDAAREAARRPVVPIHQHPFPTCFGCGPLRERGDALRHECGRLPDRDVVACEMTTDPALPHSDGVLAPEIVWSALDCPSAAACVPPGSPPHVLDTFTVRRDRPVRVSEPYAVMAWPLGADGRKRYGAAAIVDAHGAVCAVAAAVWVAVRTG